MLLCAGNERSCGSPLERHWLFCHFEAKILGCSVWWHFGNLRTTMFVSPNFSACLMLRYSPLYSAVKNPASILTSWFRGLGVTIYNYQISACYISKRVRADQVCSLSFEVLNIKSLIACFLCTSSVLPAPRQRTSSLLWEISNLNNESSSVRSGKVI